METILTYQHTASDGIGQVACPVADTSHVAVVRRTASDLAARQGFDATGCGEVAIVATEAATNILKHAGHGEVLVRPVPGGVELLAIDSGPGMANIAASMQDGRSTAGSYGVGLGAMARMSSSFDAWSAPGKGAVFAMTLLRQDAASRGDTAPLALGVVCQPIPGETACGDGWALAYDATSATVLVADGLGHGPDAARAAQAAIAAMLGQPAQAPAQLMANCHGALRATRGAAVALVRIDMLDNQLLLAGVGNIASQAWLGSARRQLVSHNGIVGSNLRKVQEFAAPWGADAMLLLHSDGIGSRWNLDDYPGLAARHPAVIAAVLYRDFGRRRDDATVLVLRDARSFAP